MTRGAPSGSGRGAPAGPSRGWREVRAAIVGRIEARDWRPGALIPAETELARELGVARATVHRALRELAGAGVIERRRRAGTRVALGAPRDARLDIPSVRAEIAASGAPYRYERLARETLAAAPALDGARALRLRCRHFAGDRPTCLEERLVSLEAVPEAAAELFLDIGPNDWLRERVPLSDVEHALSAENAAPDAALALGLEPGAALFVIERCTWLGERMVTRVRLSRPGAGYRLVAHRAGAAQDAMRGAE